MNPPVQTQIYIRCSGCGRRIPAEHFGLPSMHGKNVANGRKCRPKEEKSNG